MSLYRPRILVIDDEPQIHRFLTPALEAAGYEPVRADDAASGLRELARKTPDAVILDLGLPDMDGKEALRKARLFYAGPVVILSAREHEAEKIDALDLGADDYVQKPFAVGELLARLRVLLRRRSVQPVAEIIRGGALEIDIEMRAVRRAGVLVHLSPKEFELLARLALGGGRILTHKHLLTAVWGPAHDDDLAYLRVFIGQLRQKLEDDPSSPARIVTEPGVGYRFVADLKP